MQELDLVEDAADDERCRRRATWPASIASSATSAISRTAPDRRLGVPGATEPGPGRGPRRRRARRSRRLASWPAAGSASSGWSTATAVELEQPQPPDPVHRGRHRAARRSRLMAARIRAFNSGIRVQATAAPARDQAQLAESSSPAPTSSSLRPTGRPTRSRHWCNAACFASGIPYIAMAQLPPKVRVGPLYVPGLTGCYECQRIAWRRDYPIFDSIVEQQTGAAARPPRRWARRPV